MLENLLAKDKETLRSKCKTVRDFTFQFLHLVIAEVAAHISVCIASFVEDLCVLPSFAICVLLFV